MLLRSCYRHWENQHWATVPTWDDSLAVYTAVYFFPAFCSFDITEPMIKSAT